MSVTAISKVVTANDLRSGEVLYLRFPHSWTPELAKASVIKDNDLAIASLAFAQGQPDTVVGAGRVSSHRQAQRLHMRATRQAGWTT